MPVVEYKKDKNCLYVMKNGELHNMAGPARVFFSSEEDMPSSLKSYLALPSLYAKRVYRKEWWVSGALHRDDFPAVEDESYSEWCQNGKLCRFDGPAVEHQDGFKEWFIHGEALTEEEFNERMKPKEYPTLEINPHGVKIWTLNGQTHRTDGPAVEYLDGSAMWYQYDQLHRLDGPAVEWATGQKAWFIEGKEVDKSSKNWKDILMKSVATSLLAMYWLCIEPEEDKPIHVHEIDTKEQLSERFQEIVETDVCLASPEKATACVNV